MTTALMYHDVVPAGAEDTSGFPGRDAALYKVTPELFGAHLRAIVNAARQPSSTSPSITFDDGGVSALRTADMLEDHGFRGHFFVTANYVATRGFVNERHLRDLHARGHVIGSHSCSHPLRMGRCDGLQLLDEWTRSAAILAGIIGEAITVASIPGGDLTPAVADAAARAGIADLFTSEPTRETRPAFGLTLRGRFTIQRRTTAATVAALVTGDWLPAARQAMLWNSKKVFKRLGGERYLQLRKVLLGHGNEVRWGDQP
jgi:peptidoglycan/xylan/chitin deacetylase (PgdA/CDA1 family)